MNYFKIVVYENYIYAIINLQCKNQETNENNILFRRD